jgi:hypothetical protein
MALIRLKDFNINNSGEVLVTEEIQKVLNDNQGSTIIFDEGKYLVSSLFIKSGTTIIFENACLIATTEEKEYPIHTDIKIIVKGEIDFYICMNLWYSSLEVIDKFLLADYEEDNEMYSEANENNDDLKLLNKDKMTSLKSLSDYSIKNDINFSSQNKNNVKEDKYEIIDDTLCLNKNGFLIFNEDKMEIANNNKKDIDEIFNDKNNKNLKHTRPTFTSAIKHGSQLNTIISKLNENRKLSGKKEFDKNNVIINLTYDQLDKFKQKKTMKDLTVEICYSIE